ncbi:MAG: tetratricopeptide repeat protein [Myxococcota bacterium]|nr:tetratricopeptide repeat protein [Myxococcota bacterium]
MKCPSCQHENVSDFPFCEECLTLLPARPGNELAFELDIATTQEPEVVAGWPPFPWNPSRLPNRLVGREKVLHELLNGWTTTVSTWTSRLHLLVSEFGMGKSQITRRLAADAKKREPDAKIIRVRCPERGGPYRLWDVILREMFEIPDTATGIEFADLLRAGVGQYLQEEATEVARAIADLLGYQFEGQKVSGEGDGEAVVSRGVGALSRLLTAVASEPFLLIVAQANRGSSSSLALMGALEASLKDRPAMMLLTGTPELTQILPGWERFPVTVVDALPKKSSQEIVKMFLTGLQDVPDELVERIVERGRGNPWAIKSMLHYLGEAGAIRVQAGQYIVDESVCWDLEWPEDLEGVILARLGTLSPRDRTILGLAAVVGPVFWTGTIVAIERRDILPMEEPGDTVRDNLSWSISRSLERLAALRFIQREETRLTAEDAWMFRSSLHHKVAATIVPEAARQRLHAVVEQWLRVHSDHTDREYLVELARHAEYSGDKTRAVRYNIKAASEALNEHIPSEAQLYYEQADALVHEDDRPTRLHIAIGLGQARLALGDHDGALVSFQTALHMAWQLRERQQGADALVRIGEAEAGAGRYHRAERHFESAMRLYEEKNVKDGLAKTCVQMGRVYWLKGRHVEALQSYRKAERTYEQLGNQHGLGVTADAIASLHYDRGDLEEAERFYRRAIKLRNACDDPRGVAAGLCNLGATWLNQGHTDKAIDAWNEGLELAALIGDSGLQAMLGGNLGEAYLSQDKLVDAADYFDRALQWADLGANPRALASIRLNRAAILMRSEKWSEAVAELELADELCQELDIPRLHGQLQRMTAELFVAKYGASGEQARQKHANRAVEKYQESISQFVEAGCNLEAAATHERLADFYDKLDQKSEAVNARGAAATLRNTHESNSSPRLDSDSKESQL